MTSPTPDPSSGVPSTGRRELDVTVRTAPKIWAFLGSGLVLGAVVALVFTWISHAQLVQESTDGQVEFSFGSAFGFFLVIFGLLGVALGAVVFLLVDRIGRRRSRTVHVTVEPAAEGDEGPSVGPPSA